MNKPKPPAPLSPPQPPQPDTAAEAITDILGQIRRARAAGTVGEPSPLDALRHEDIPPAQRQKVGDPPELVAVLGSRLREHGGAVVSRCWVRFSPDGRRFASAGAGSREVRVWDAQLGQPIQTFEAEPDRYKGLHGLCWSPDGNYLASYAESTGGSSYTVIVWNARSGGTLRRFRGRDGYQSLWPLCFSPDSKRLAYQAGRPNNLVVRDLQGDRVVELARPPYSMMVSNVVFTPDGKSLVVSEGGEYVTAATVKVFDAESGKELLALDGAKPKGVALALSPDGKSVALSCEAPDKQHCVRLFDLTTGRALRTLEGTTPKGIEDLAFDSRGERLAGVCRGGSVQIWAPKTDKLLRTVQGLATPLFGGLSWDFSPDGRRLVSADEDGVIKIWDAERGEELLANEGHGHWITDLTCSLDGRRLSSYGWDRNLCEWDLTTGRLESKRHLPGGPLDALGPGGLLAGEVGGWRDRLTLWDLRTARALGSVRGNFSGWPRPCFRADGRLLAIPQFKPAGVLLLDLPTLRSRALTALPGDPTCLAFSPDGRRLATAAYADKEKTNSEVRLWDAETGQGGLTLPRLKGEVKHLLFSPDGGRLTATLTFDKQAAIKTWATASGKELFTLSRPDRNAWGGPAIGPDGRILACPAENAVELRIAAGGRLDRTIRVEGSLGHLQFAPDGRHLIGTSGRATIVILRVAPKPARKK